MLRVDLRPNESRSEWVDRVEDRPRLPTEPGALPKGEPHSPADLQFALRALRGVTPRVVGQAIEGCVQTTTEAVMIFRAQGVGAFAIAGLLLIGATACGGDEAASTDLASLDGSAQAATDDAASAGAGDGADGDASLLEVAECMRTNGVPDFPDPVVSADGTASFDFQAMTETGVDPQDPAFEQAIEECGELLDGTTLGGGPFADDPDAQDRLLEFAQCMRDNGVPDFEDPQIGTGGPPAGGGGGHRHALPGGGAR